ncbi:class I SAM-dependent methyltransferase [Roseicella frigidaeris]|uniref:Methyltransferase n=1 Tax=Roseicella frigidaeris TaxID=2230885 RepID=A0A327M938_9PROT|nr:class I SAM-dependent methyltransferase [Roseicella frigidaeris]RAI59460.1 methyltransferase [Roseicella frigidaeris]
MDAALISLFDGRLVPNEPDRKYLTSVIFPNLVPLEPGRVLFVGCRSYTKPYEAFFQDSEYWTLEIDPIHAKWGSKNHKTGDVRHADSLFAPGYFDLVFLNGVLGFGVDADDDQDMTFAALHRIMRPGAILLVGWNEGRCSDPLTRPTLGAAFRHQALCGMPARKGFAASTHVYDLFRAVGGSPSRADQLCGASAGPALRG